MKTKEFYIAPSIEILNLETEGIIASSIGTEETPVPEGRAKRHFWRSDEEE